MSAPPTRPPRSALADLHAYVVPVGPKMLRETLCVAQFALAELERVAWRDAPNAAHGVPVRCRICGGRKCDTPVCRLRRHHREEHEEF